MGLYGLADALVQGGVIDAIGEMPERYMQVVIVGIAAISQFWAFVAMGFGSEERRKRAEK